MKFKIGEKVVVKNVYSGGNFENGDIVIVSQIGNEYIPNCYGAVSPHDGFLWFLYEEEVGPATNADLIRYMSDKELCKFLNSIYAAGTNDGNMRDGFIWDLDWLRQPAEED